MLDKPDLGPDPYFSEGAGGARLSYDLVLIDKNWGL